MNQMDFDTYQSPYSWRYGSAEMRQLFSERQRRLLWRRVWVALARAQASLGLISSAQLEDIEAHASDVDLERSLQIESMIHHDVMAEIRVYAEQCSIGGGVIHLGATSMDIVDNADVLRQRHALDLVLSNLRRLIQIFAQISEDYAETPVLGYTHLQPAAPTTLGYRFAQTLQDLVWDYREICRVRHDLMGKGFKGSVGNLAAFEQLLAGSGRTAADLEVLALSDLDLRAFPVTTQTYPRKQDWQLLNALAGLAGSLHRFAFDLRILQMPAIGELSEPFASTQVGSSAMPYKRNPITAEKINSIARFVASLPSVVWQNAALQLLERTLDDSANRRNVIPEAFLATDEMMLACTRIVANIGIWPGAIQQNMSAYGVFAATERLLMEAVKAGGNRQHLHEVIRRHSLTAWSAVQRDDPNPLVDLLKADSDFTSFISPDQIVQLLDASNYVGEASDRARQMAVSARNLIGRPCGDESRE